MEYVTPIMQGSLAYRLYAVYTRQQGYLVAHLSKEHLFIAGGQPLNSLDSLASSLLPHSNIDAWTEQDLVAYNNLCDQELTDRFLQGLGLLDRSKIDESMRLFLNQIYQSEMVGREVIADKEAVKRMIRVVRQWYEYRITQEEAYEKSMRALRAQIDRYAARRTARLEEDASNEPRTYTDSVPSQCKDRSPDQSIQANTMVELTADQDLVVESNQGRSFESQIPPCTSESPVSQNTTSQPWRPLFRRQQQVNGAENSNSCFRSSQISSPARRVCVATEEPRRGVPWRQKKTGENNFGYGSPTWGSATGNAFGTLLKRRERQVFHG
ncbi:hypothetical protein LTS08_000219 [Lithohypha guttulata]|nr:hypothetical protein LTS08_000219 [Lithohypha guttulata]